VKIESMMATFVRLMIRPQWRREVKYPSPKMDLEKKVSASHFQRPQPDKIRAEDDVFNRMSPSLPESAQVSPSQLDSAQVIFSSKPESARVSQNQPESARISQNQPELARINQSQPESGRISHSAQVIKPDLAHYRQS
jgi:hypothetical protein